MTIKNLEEHKHCFNYEGENEPFIQLVEGMAASCGTFSLNNHVVFLILKGEVKFTYSTFSNVSVRENQMIFVPVGSELDYESAVGFKCFMFRLEDEIRFCDRSTGAMLKEISASIKKELPYIIAANDLIRNYAEGIEYIISCKMLCRVFIDLKRKELLYLLRMFYSKRELALFFYEGLFENTSFSCEVIRNYHRYTTVSALASSLHYTTSGFEKRFKKTFGVSPSKWLREQKSKEIYRDVCLGKLNFKEISDKYNFSSTSTFSDFYKTIFGETPGVTRKKQTKGLV